MSLRSTKTLVEKVNIEASMDDVRRALALLHGVEIPANAAVRYRQSTGPDGEDMGYGYVFIGWTVETDVQEVEDE